MRDFGKRGFSTQSTQWQLSAYAKVNLGLWVAPRDNRGYHPVWSVMQSISMADVIRVTPSSHYHVEMNVPLEQRQFVPSLANNLITRAYHGLKDQYPEIPTVKIQVNKHIPIGSGLGGGSADAAAILRWAQMVINKKIDPKFAANLGVDVPFLISGGTAQATGYGEDLKYLHPLRGWYVVLVSPNFGLSTRHVYNAFDTLPNSSHLSIESMQDVIRRLELGSSPISLFNALEPAAWKVEPKLKNLKADLRSVSRKPWFLTGSGATYFTLLRSYEESLALQKDLVNRKMDNVAGIDIAEFVGPF